MDDLYSELIGEGAPTAEIQAKVAAALRKRKVMSTLAQMSGDPILAPYGSGESKDVEDQVKQFQGIRQKDIDNLQTKTYQTGQLKHMDETLAETRRNNDMENRYRLMMAMAALEKANKSGSQFKMTNSDRNKLENISQLTQNSSDLMDTFKPEYTQKLGPGPQSMFPNAAAAMGVGTEGSKDAANWWSQWNLIYTLPQRNATFGATLTPHEQRAWKESDINPSMSDKQIQERAGNVLKILKNKGVLMDKEYRAAGANPDVMDTYGLGGDQSTPATKPTAPTKATESWSIGPDGKPVRVK